MEKKWMNGKKEGNKKTDEEKKDYNNVGTGMEKVQKKEWTKRQRTLIFNQ